MAVLLPRNLSHVWRIPRFLSDFRLISLSCSGFVISDRPRQKEALQALKLFVLKLDFFLEKNKHQIRHINTKQPTQLFHHVVWQS